MSIKECQTVEKFEEILLNNAIRPAFLFKHYEAWLPSDLEPVRKP